MPSCATMSHMGRKQKATNEAASDRHVRKALSLRLHPLLRQQLEILVDRNASNVTAEISIAIREKLERVGLWPPRDD